MAVSFWKESFVYIYVSVSSFSLTLTLTLTLTPPHTHLKICHECVSCGMSVHSFSLTQRGFSAWVTGVALKCSACPPAAFAGSARQGLVVFSLVWMTSTWSHLQCRKNTPRSPSVPNSTHDDGSAAFLTFTGHSHYLCQVTWRYLCFSLLLPLLPLLLYPTRQPSKLRRTFSLLTRTTLIFFAHSGAGY